MLKGKYNPEKYWRYLANIWLVVTVFIIVVDFWSGGKYTYLIPPLSILYITLLSVYITSKEFKRWGNRYQGRHPGEIAIVRRKGVSHLFHTFSLTNFSLLPNMVVGK